ncbi:hypothetical protein [Parabacteroides sp. FAFU027]|uniref:hypothetical protein n=1 Tax=Parabacteroides sp. FAFU027 TaxID=2922715 RepID=UPI001FB007C4|nr:hypothetical protein [Parabacteroides sp. FAFU027]
MKAASLSEIRTTLNHLPPEVLSELCIRLIKYKKENKEFLSYLLYEADDETGYVDGIKKEMDILFKEVNRRNLTLSKKTLQKILRQINRYAKYSGSKRTDADLHIYFCLKLRESGLPLDKNATLQNIYMRQLTRIHKALATLHEDLQYDYEEVMEKLMR